MNVFLLSTYICAVVSSQKIKYTKITVDGENLRMVTQDIHGNFEEHDLSGDLIKKISEKRGEIRRSEYGDETKPHKSVIHITAEERFAWLLNALSRQKEAATIFIMADKTYDIKNKPIPTIFIRLEWETKQISAAPFTVANLKRIIRLIRD